MVSKRVETFDFGDKKIIVSPQTQLFMKQKGIDEEHIIWELKCFMHHLNLPIVFIKLQNGWLTFQTRFRGEN